MQLDQGLTTGSLFAGRYNVRRPLGVGGMGVVYLAHDSTLDEEVALKVLHPHRSADQRLAERFLLEVKLSRRIVSPHIVRTFDVGTENGQLFFTMEYISGQSLKERILHQALKPLDILRILSDISAGLAAIHQAGVTHRDLKPSNIILPFSGGTKIADFGVARERVSELTNSDEVIGSIEYIAPECWTNHAVSAASDLYSLGVIAYELLTGTLPFSGNTTYEVMIKTVNQIPLNPRQFKAEVPEWLDQLVLDLLAKQPSARPESAEKVHDLIERKLSFEQSLNPAIKSQTRARPSAQPLPVGSAAFFRSVILGMMRQAHVMPESSPTAGAPLVEEPLLKRAKAQVNEERRDSALIFRPADWVSAESKWSKYLSLLPKVGALTLGLAFCALLMRFYWAPLMISRELEFSTLRVVLNRLLFIAACGTSWQLFAGIRRTVPFDGARWWGWAMITSFFVGIISIATSTALVFNQLPSTDQHQPFILISFMSAVGASLTNLLEASLVIPPTALFAVQMTQGSAILLPSATPRLGLLLYFVPLLALLLITGATKQQTTAVNWRTAARFALAMMVLVIFEMAICGMLTDPANLSSQLNFVLPLGAGTWRTSAPAIFFAALNWVLISVGLPWRRNRR